MDHEIWTLIIKVRQSILIWIHGRQDAHLMVSITFESPLKACLVDCNDNYIGIGISNIGSDYGDTLFFTTVFQLQ